MRSPMGGLFSRLIRSHFFCECRGPLNRSKPQRGERVGAETIDQSPGDGEAGIAGILRRGAGDAATRAAHPRPDDRPRPPSASGSPVRGRAQADIRGRARRLRGRPARIASFEASSHPVRSPHRHFVHFRSCDCPVGVEGAPESNCSLRFSRMPRSPQFQLRIRPGCNLPPRAFSCTRV